MIVLLAESSLVEPRTLARRAEDSGAVGLVIVDNEEIFKRASHARCEYILEQYMSSDIVYKSVCMHTRIYIYTHTYTNV